jgi:hypothetical protein
MPFHLFAPPSMHVMPILLTAGLAFATGVILSRRGVSHAIAGLRNKVAPRLAFWRRSSPDLGGRVRPHGSSAFEDYRRATLFRLEDEAREFRSFLDRLRQAADAADFEAFLKARRQGSHKDIATN